ncbi:hypothetical protein BDZ88DRAFT_426416 [Geranomyces variabilis]|nr:hypothetical protein BDZ88DRAFT_426416 [Geranomyces variabilis]KAJ3136458.1 hypothetical protein HDU90_003168 [Geranomyces variabilis]
MLSIEFALVPSSSQDTPGPLIRRKNMMPDTVAQIIVKLLAAKIIKKKQYSSFLNPALACRSLKLAAYQRIRPELMRQQAEWVKKNFPLTAEKDALSDFCDLFHVTGNLFVDLDPFIIALFPSTKLLKRCRASQLDVGMEPGTVTVGSSYKDDGLWTCTAHHGRWLRQAENQECPSWLMKNALFHQLKGEPHMIRCPYAVVQFNTDDPGFEVDVTYFAAVGDGGRKIGWKLAEWIQTDAEGFPNVEKLDWLSDSD